MAPRVLPPAKHFGNSQRIPRVSASGGLPLTSGSGVGGIWKDSLAAGFSGSLENGTQQEGAESRRCVDNVGRSARNRFDRARRQALHPSAGDCYPPSSLGGQAHGGSRDLPGAPPCRAQAWRVPEPPVQSGQVRRPASSFTNVPRSRFVPEPLLGAGLYHGQDRGRLFFRSSCSTWRPTTRTERQRKTYHLGVTKRRGQAENGGSEKATLKRWALWGRGHPAEGQNDRGPRTPAWCFCWLRPHRGPRHRSGNWAQRTQAACRGHRAEKQPRWDKAPPSRA